MNQKLNEELDIFQAALNIEDPWFVSYRQFDQANNVDIDTKKVLYATEGKGSDVLHAFKAFLKERGIPATQIEACCCDMSPAFIKGVQEAFPKAEITFDKFHVMKMVNEAGNKVRREEQKDHAELKKTRFIWA